MNATFPKSAKLCGQIRIASLYKEGQRMTCFPIRVTYRPATDTQVLIWAPKSLFKHAVDRNRLRRQMREAWRLNQHLLVGNWQIAFNYMDKQMLDYKTIAHGMLKAIQKINKNSDA